MRKKTIVYVLGLGHSGSTILEYLICQNPKALGLGEVFKLTGQWSIESRSRQCTCQEKVESCELWGPLNPSKGESNEQWYKRLEEHLRETFPNQDLWIDTSKSIREFKSWQALASNSRDLELKIIYLIRDVRGWVWSDARVRERKQRNYRSISASMIFWYIQQLRLRRASRASRLQSHLVLYESLVHQPQKEMDKLFSFLGVQDCWKMGTNLVSGSIHDVTGNRMKGELSDVTRLEYNRKWMSDAEIRSWYQRLWPVRRFMDKIYIAAKNINKNVEYNASNLRGSNSGAINEYPK